MSAKRLLIISIMSILLMALPACAESSGKLDIVSTTSVLWDPVAQIGGDKVNVIYISNPAICPHMQSDVIQNNLQLNKDFISKADMFVANNGSIDKEYVMPYVADFMKSNGFGEVKWYTLKDPSMTWNKPENAKKLAAEVKGWLAEKDPDNAAYYEENYNEYVKKIDAAEPTEQEKGLLGQQNVIVMLWQQDAVQNWLGINVVNIFAPEFAMNGTKTPAKLVDDIKANPDKYKDVKFIIENMQSGELAKGVEEALKDEGINVKRVVFTNYPRSVEGVESIPDLLKYNKDLILENAAEPTNTVTPTQTPVGMIAVIAGMLIGTVLVLYRSRNN
ncbi:metal ABC transporter substrate-binding protein [Methanocella sp. CWC-04]|uniref:Metal ABC transporter substrate-binding protein n=1 Tax=Methanooceanicella nereidis TaxID=2052831 RepID=A0AAP2RE07_9EURY|nr:metal ABC transporter substrate-binding protein [Methanocella sp. CWC-04]MCD1295417.1 metal ABC transporter substrate-binding protein [Methanocella sp. CWC-04]